MPPAARGLRVALGAALVAGAFVACQGADPYYRHRADGVAGQSGAAGVYASAGTTGAAGVYSFGGATGAAGTTGAAGAASLSGAAGAGPCTTCMVKVQYTCRADAGDTQQTSFVLDVTNESSTPIALTRLTLRYWYTIDAAEAASQELDCDYAKLGCTNVVTSANTPGPRFVPVLPPAPTANLYVEIAFEPGALTLDPFLDTGEIQLRLHDKDGAALDKNDDWSFSCATKGAPIDANKITAYVDGALVWGEEPQ